MNNNQDHKKEEKKEDVKPESQDTARRFILFIIRCLFITIVSWFFCNHLLNLQISYMVILTGYILMVGLVDTIKHFWKS